MLTQADASFVCTIEIEASQERVWDVLLSPGEWGRAFGEGTLVDVTWQEGASIIWKDSENNIGANGRVEIIEPTAFLQLRYYDDVEPSVGASLGPYYEKFTIAPSGNKSSRLVVEVGELKGEDAAFHRKLWEEALMYIRTIAIR